jgi:RimJ/RimL family protein N-acetyltransferase
MPELPLPEAGALLRPFAPTDAAALARHANDRGIWLNLRDRFPHPYTRDDADRYLAHVVSRPAHTALALDVDGEAVGGIGCTLLDDVERVGAEVGYWIGAAHWGRGVATAALRAYAPLLLAAEPGLRRLYALPFAWNAASARVLEKAGWRLEGRLRQSAIKDGEVTDQLMYALLRDELPGADPTR